MVVGVWGSSILISILEWKHGADGLTVVGYLQYEMILQILANARQIDDGLNIELFEMGRVANARQLENLR